MIDTWLSPLRKLRAENAGRWKGLDEKQKGVALVEANVRQGVQTLRENPDVIEGVEERGVELHGCVYDIATGVVRELQCKEDRPEEENRLEAFLTKLTKH